MLGVITALKNIIGVGFYFSYKTGQFLVTALTLLLSNAAAFASQLLTVLKIIYEDFTIFLLDLWERLNYLASSATYLGNQLTLKVIKFYETVINTGTLIGDVTAAICYGIANGIVAIYLGIIHLVWFIKHLIVLMGQGVWFLITFMPLSIVQFLTVTISSIKLTLSEMYNYMLNLRTTGQNVCKNMYNFVTDVPTESVLGLMAGICIVYVIVQFYTALLAYLTTVLTSVISATRRKYNYWKRRLLRKMQRSRIRLAPAERIVRKTDSSSKEHEDNNCVICHERVKCILILPCRHLCLCGVCNARLPLYNDTCPICRENIERTMKVFV